MPRNISLGGELVTQNSELISPPGEDLGGDVIMGHRCAPDRVDTGVTQSLGIQQWVSFKF